MNGIGIDGKIRIGYDLIDSQHDALLGKVLYRATVWHHTIR